MFHPRAMENIYIYIYNVVVDIYALCAFLCAEITFFNMRWQRLTHIGSVETNGIEDCCWFFLFGFLDLVYIFSKTYNFVSK